MKVEVMGSVHPNMVKLINIFNALDQKEKTIIMASLGESQDISDEGQKILEILNNIGADHKQVFIDLIKNNVKLSQSEGRGSDESDSEKDSNNQETA